MYTRLVLVLSSSEITIARVLQTAMTNQSALHVNVNEKIYQNSGILKSNVRLSIYNICARFRLVVLG